FQAQDGIREFHVTGVQTCALPIYPVAAVGVHTDDLTAAGDVDLATGDEHVQDAHRGVAEVAGQVDGVPAFLGPPQQPARSAGPAVDVVVIGGSTGGVHRRGHPAVDDVDHAVGQPRPAHGAVVVGTEVQVLAVHRHRGDPARGAEIDQRLRAVGTGCVPPDVAAAGGADVHVGTVGAHHVSGGGIAQVQIDGVLELPGAEVDRAEAGRALVHRVA